MSEQPSKQPQERGHRKPLEPNAAAELQQILDGLRRTIIDKAEQVSAGAAIQSDDLAWAYRVTVEFGEEPPRWETAKGSQAIISAALRENRICEVISYLLAIAIFAAGLSLVISAGFGDAPLESRIGSLVAGAVLEIVFLVPLRIAVNSRRHNIALRVLGLLIDKVDDPEKLVGLLHPFAQTVAGSTKLGATDVETS